MTDPGLISVRTELVRDVLVRRIAERAAELETEVTEQAASVVTVDAERAGYATRLAERELFEPARQPASWLTDAVHARLEAGDDWTSAASTLSRELALAEPLERPQPGDERAVSWRIPGPGGHVRHYVAARIAPQQKREFIYGFLVRCCEEAR